METPKVSRMTANTSNMNYESLTLPQLRLIALERSMSIKEDTRKADIIAELKALDERRRINAEHVRPMEEPRTVRRSLRRQANVMEHVDTLEYPFSFIRSGEYDRTCQQIPGHSMESIGTFPDNISEYLWIYPGINDERPWLCLCRLDTGVHVYFRGECDYTGFDCQGSMELYAHRDPNILLQMAMTSADYAQYLEDTVEIE